MESHSPCVPTSSEVGCLSSFHILTLNSGPTFKLAQKLLSAKARPGSPSFSCSGPCAISTPCLHSDDHPLGTFPLPGHCLVLVLSAVCLCPTWDAQCDRGRWGSRVWVMLFSVLLEGHRLWASSAQGQSTDGYIGSLGSN